MMSSAVEGERVEPLAPTSGRKNCNVVTLNPGHRPGGLRTLGFNLVTRWATENVQTSGAGFQVCCIRGFPNPPGARTPPLRYNNSHTLPIWKSAIRQVWKPALRGPNRAFHIS